MNLGVTAKLVLLLGWGFLFYRVYFCHGRSVCIDCGHLTCPHSPSPILRGRSKVPCFVTLTCYVGKTSFQVHPLYTPPPLHSHKCQINVQFCLLERASICSQVSSVNTIGKKIPCPGDEIPFLALMSFCSSSQFQRWKREYRQQLIGIKCIKTTKQPSEKGNNWPFSNSDPLQSTDLKQIYEMQGPTRFEYQSHLSRTTCKRWPHFIGKCTLIEDNNQIYLGWLRLDHVIAVLIHNISLIWSTNVIALWHFSFLYCSNKGKETLKKGRNILMFVKVVDVLNPGFPQDIGCSFLPKPSVHRQWGPAN